MIQKRRGVRRIHNDGPPEGFLERRYMDERRKTDISQASINAFESLMSALGFRSERRIGE